MRKLIQAAADRIVKAERGRGCGGVGIQGDDPAQVEGALARVVNITRSGKPVLVNAIVGNTDCRKGSLSM